MRDIKKVLISLTRTGEFVYITMSAVDKLQKKNDELMERIERMENAILSIHDHMNDCASCKIAGEEKQSSELMQEGIDNILGYEWPPKKGGKR